MLAKFLVNKIGSTLSTSPPVNSAILAKVSRLHSSPTMETILTVMPLDLAHYFEMGNMEM